MHVYQPGKKRCRNKTPAHTINVQSLMASVGELQVLTLHQFDTCRSQS